MGSEDGPQAWSPLCRVEPNTWGGVGEWKLPSYLLSQSQAQEARGPGTLGLS